jgi:hypothetical protein
MRGRARSGLWVLALPIALLGATLLPFQQEKTREGSEVDALNETIPPLPSELAKRKHGQAAEFGIREAPTCWPRLIGGPDGGAWLLGVEWEPGRGDHIRARRLNPDGTAAKAKDGRLLATIEVTPAPCEAMRPSGALDAEGRLVVAWTETTDAGPVLKAARLEGERFTPPLTLTDAASHARNVELVRHDGRVWFCFESWTPPAAGSERGNVEVLLAPLDGEKLGAPVAIGDGPFSDVDPVVVSDGERLWVAWSQYQGRDFEVELRSFDAKGGKPGEALNVSACGVADDVHPSLAAGKPGELWLAWDAIVDPGRGSSVPKAFENRYADAKCGAFVMSACVRDGKVLLPPGRLGEPAGVVVGAPQFSWTGGLPQIAVAPDGAPWIAYRYLESGNRLDRYGYPLLAHHWNGAGWSAPIQFQRAAGSCEEAALLPVPDGMLLAWSHDQRLEFGPGEAMNTIPKNVAKALDDADVRYVRWSGESDLLLARLLAKEATGGALPNEQLVERVAQPDPRHYHPSPHATDDPYVTGARHFTVDQGEKHWKAWFGDLHRHSCVSRCSRGTEERPSQRWEFGRDVFLYDFFALTDHSGQIGPFEWWLEDKLVRHYRSPDYCTLAGYEWSSEEYGHQNVILNGRLQSVQLIDCGTARLYESIAKRDAIAIPHGTADLGRYAEFTAWDDKFVRLVEVYQALRGNSEFDGCLKQSKAARIAERFVQDALNAGRKFGIIASSDHGNGCAYAVALAERLDPASLMEAFRARRTYGATVKGMLIDFRIDGHVMGEECECAAPPELHVKAHGAAELAELVVFRDGKVVTSLGRSAARKDRTIEATLRLDLLGIAKAGDDWNLSLTAPSCELAKNGGSKALHRRHPNPPYPGWRPDGASAAFTWPSTFEPDEVDHEYWLDLRGPVDTRLTIEWGDQKHEIALSELIARPLDGSTPRGPFRITATEPTDAAIDLAHGLGARDVDHAFTDRDAGPGYHWYYARAIDVDGEMAWSSPIFVTRR